MSYVGACVSPYRKFPTEESTRAKRWKRFVCLFLRHDWHITRIDIERHAALVHLNDLAGCNAVCRRCGFTWLDAQRDSVRHLVAEDDE